MAVFSNTIITKKGHALVAKGMAGEQINFTKVRTSDYDYPSSTNFENLTVLGSIKQTVDISAVNIENESTVRVKAAILNTDVTTGYYVKNIGLYANDPNEGEILFSITTATTADFMPAYNGVNTTVLTVDLLTTVSNSGNVNLTVSPGGLVTTEMIATKNQYGITNFLDIRKHEILNILGLSYGGDFGTDLTSIEADKVYFYKDPVSGRETPYVALAAKTGAFITPDVNNFKSLTNRDNLFHKKLNIVTQTVNNVTLMNAYIFGNVLIVNGFIVDPTSFNSASLGTEFANLGGMIPEIANYGAYGDTISGINLIIKSNFALAKSSSNIQFYTGQHFTVITGITQGTIR